MNNSKRAASFSQVKSTNQKVSTQLGNIPVSKKTHAAKTVFFCENERYSHEYEPSHYHMKGTAPQKS